MNYEEKKQARIDRYKERAGKAKERSNNHYNTSHNLSSAIPFGQPILIGHHSEGRHRRDINRINNNMRKSIEENKKADYYENKAKAAENNHNIYSNDPEAIQKLEKRIEQIENVQKTYKDINIRLRKAKILKNDDDKYEKFIVAGFTPKEITHILNWTKYTYNGKDYITLPGWMLSNNNASKNALKKRIEHIKATKEKIIEFEDVKTEKGYITKNEEHQGIEIHFPGKPEQEIIDKLKMYGFRWARFNKVWYKKYSEIALIKAKEIIA